MAAESFATSDQRRDRSRFDLIGTSASHRGGSAPVAQWIRQREANGSRPEIIHIESARTAEEAASIEHAFITFFADRGHELLNVRRRSAYVPTIAHRIVISRAMRGRRASFATRLRMSAAARRAAARRRRDGINATQIGVGKSWRSLTPFEFTSPAARP
jgi:hypothetical protein